MRTSILIIDRDENAVKELRRAFELQGAEVVVTADGEEGLQIAERQSPSLIVLAIELQTTSGYSICKKIKKNTHLASLPLFITSSTATPDIFEQHKRLKTRAEEYFFKPLDVARLLQTAQGYVAIGGETVVMDPGAGGPGPIEVADDLLIADDSDVIELDEPPQDQEPTRVVDQATLRPSGFGTATEAEIDSAIGELSGVLGEEQDAGAADAGLELGGSAAVAFTPRPSRPAPPASSRPRTIPGPDESGPALRAEINRLSDLLRRRDEQFAALRTTSSASEREFLALRSELNQKEREILTLKDQLFGKDAELLELRERGDELDARLGSQTAEVSRLTARVATAEGQAAELSAQLEAAQADLRATTGRLSDFERKNSELTQGQRAALQEVDGLKAKLDQVQTDLSRTLYESENARQELQEQLEAASKAAAEAEAALRSDVEAARGALEATKSELEAAKRAAAEAQTKAEAELEAAKQAAAKAEASLRAELDLAKESAAETEAALRAELEQSQGTATEAHQAREAAEARIAEAERQAEERLREAEEKAQQTLDSRIEAVRTQAHSDHTDALERLREELEAARSEAVRAKDDEISTLQTRVSSADGELEHLRQEVVELTASAEHHRDELSATESKLTSTREALETARQELETTQAALSETQATLEGVETQRDEAQAKAKEAEEGLEAARQELSSATSQAETLRTEVQDLESRLESETAALATRLNEEKAQVQEQLRTIQEEKGRLEIEQQTALEALEERVAEANRRADELERERTRRESRLAELDAEVHELRQLQADLNSVLEATSAMQRRLEGRANLYRSILEQIASLATSLPEEPEELDLALETEVVELVPDDVVAADANGPVELAEEDLDLEAEPVAEEGEEPETKTGVTPPPLPEVE